MSRIKSINDHINPRDLSLIVIGTFHHNHIIIEKVIAF